MPMPKKPKWLRRSQTPAAPTNSSQSPAPLPPPAQPSLPQSTIPTSSKSGAGSPDGFVDRALELLTKDQRRIIEEHMSQGAKNLAAVVSDARKAALEKKDVCVAKQWSFTLGNRKIRLRQVVDKVVELLDNVKAVGDVASNADPVHAGLPWAGIRLILGVAVSEHQQMTTLLRGIERVLFIASELQAYLDLIKTVPACIERTSLDNALVEYYVCVLEFLADAIVVFGKSTPARILHAFISPNACTGFEEKSRRLAERTAEDASACERVLQRDRHSGSVQNFSEVLKKLEKLQVSVKINEVKIDMRLLPVAEGAEFDSYDEQHLSKCYTNTREALLRDIYAWAADRDGKPIFWLNGMAGTGKSTIARTVAQHWLDEQRLGGSFFFKRGEGDRSHGKRFFPTLVSQLFQNMPDLQGPIADILGSFPNIAEKGLQQQFEKLFLESFIMQAALDTTNANIPAPVILVVDALDECDERDIVMILSLLCRGPNADQLRVFLTGRPDLYVQLGFGDMKAEQYQKIALHEIAQQSVEHDITVFVQHNFEVIRLAQEKRIRLAQERGQLWDPLPRSWPSQMQLGDLVQRSMPLFIFAATICRFIGDERSADPVNRLDQVLRQQDSLPALDQTYLPVMQQLCINNDNDPDIKGTTLLLAAITVLEETLPVNPLARLLDMKDQDIKRRLDLFHSVLRFPSKPSDPIRILHLSFREFLVPKHGTKIRHPFALAEAEVHRHLAIKCLSLLSKSLHRDMCSRGLPGVRRNDVPQDVITNVLHPALSYACRYWTYHVYESVQVLQLSDFENIFRFLRTHLLHWLESLSWLGQSTESLIHITSLLSMLETSLSGNLESLLPFKPNVDPGAQTDQLKEVHRFLKDAQRFTLTNRYMIDRAPLQLYASCLLFAPDLSFVKDEFKSEHMLDLACLPRIDSKWSSELQRLKHSDGWVGHAVLSPNADMVASDSKDYGKSEYAVVLWNVTTGQEVLVLDHSSKVIGFAFSPDGSKLITASSTVKSSEVRMWEIRDGRLSRTLATMEGIKSFTCRSDFQEFAVVIWKVEENKEPEEGWELSGIKPPTTELHVYSITTGKPTWIFVEGNVRQVLYSSDGCTMAVTCDKDQMDRQIYVMTPPMTGELRRFKTGNISDMALSSDGTQLAAQTFDDHELSIVIWNVGSGEKTFRYDQDIAMVGAISFSPCGSLIASVSVDKSIALWNTTTGDVLRRFEGHDDNVQSISFSREGTLIASASNDGTVCVWDAKYDHDEASQQDDRRLFIDGFASGVIINMSFSNDGRRVAVDLLESYRIYETCPLRLETEFNLERLVFGGYRDCSPDGIADVRMSPDGKSVCSAGSNGVRLYKLPPRVLLWQADNWKGVYRRVRFSPDSSLVACEHDTNRVVLFSTTSGKTIHVVDREPGGSNTLVISSNNRMIAYDCGKVIRYCNLERGTKLTRSIRHDDDVTDIAFSHDARVIAFTTNTTVHLWSVSTGRQVWRLKNYVSISQNPQLVFSADDEYLLVHATKLRIERQSGSSKRQDQFMDLEGGWIVRDGHDLIWLPHLYQKGKHVAHSSGNMIAFMTPAQRDPVLIKFQS